jgi:hypothetical protein
LFLLRNTTKEGLSHVHFKPMELITIFQSGCFAVMTVEKALIFIALEGLALLEIIDHSCCGRELLSSFLFRWMHVVFVAKFEDLFFSGCLSSF